MRYLEDLVVGEERLSKSVRVSAKEIIEFASLFDPQPFHIDPEEAAKAHSIWRSDRVRHPHAWPIGASSMMRSMATSPISAGLEYETCSP